LFIVYPFFIYNVEVFLYFILNYIMPFHSNHRN
jgi:phage shock protein PspC (stress-responsive transcriptional regulator)